MNLAEWITRVLSIAAGKGLSVSTTYPGPGLVTFAWRGTWRQGVAGAGVSMISLTTPEEFTRLWYDAAPPQSPTLSGPAPPDDIVRTDRRGRFVPRVPAMAVSSALQELFK